VVAATFEFRGPAGWCDVRLSTLALMHQLHTLVADLYRITMTGPISQSLAAATKFAKLSKQ
jgi:hypothetical protein